MSKIKVCHFSTVHSIIDTRVFHRECVSLAKHFDATFIGIGNFTGIRNDVNIIGIPKPESRIQRMFSSSLKVFKLAIKTKAKIYHIHDAEMIPFGIIFSLLGKKVIYDIHENTKQDILLKPWIPESRKKIIANAYELTLKIASKFLHFIPVVAHEKFLPIFQVKKNQYTVIQNYADANQMKKYCIEDRNILPGNHLFYIGMIKDMYYDFGKLLDAVYLLKQENFPVYVHCVGYYGARTNPGFDEHPRWKEVKDNFHFYGYLDMDTGYQISMQCKVGICIKNQPENMLVSHERKFFEYMAIGLPSIFCNSEIYTEVLNKFPIGIAVDLQNPNEIATALKKLFTDKTFYDNCVNSCKAAIDEKYNWESQEILLLDLYQKLIANA